MECGARFPWLSKASSNSPSRTRAGKIGPDAKPCHPRHALAVRQHSSNKISQRCGHRTRAPGMSAEAFGVERGGHMPNAEADAESQNEAEPAEGLSDKDVESVAERRAGSAKVVHE